MITIDLWLYGPMARYVEEQDQSGYANLQLEMADGSNIDDLIRRLGIPAEERGITFINGNLAALPGIDADLSVELQDGDRVGISHRKSMWPFQYRFGAQMTPQLKQAFRDRPDRGVHHAYTRWV